MGMIPKTTKSEVKIFGNFGMKRLIIVMGTFVVSMQLSDFLVAKSLSVPFSLFLSLTAFVLTIKDPMNPKRDIFWRIVKVFRFYSGGGNRAYLSITGMQFKNFWRKEKSIHAQDNRKASDIKKFGWRK